MTRIVEIREKKLTNYSNELYLSDLLLRHWKIKENDQITVQFGTKETLCTILTNPSLKENECHVSTHAYQSLLLPFQISLSMNYDGSSKLYLGPIIGIFTAGFTGSIIRPIGERSFLFAKYIHAAKTTGAFALLFGSHHIHWEDGYIEGYSFRESGWEKVEVPLPNVVYDRLPNRKTESHPTYSDIKERMQKDYKIPWFNPGFFDKSLMYQQLIDIEEVSHLLPHTIASPTTEDITNFVHEYNHIYIKPSNGSLGLGIQQIIYDKEDGFYYCRFRDHTRNRLRRYGSIVRLLKMQFPKGFETMVVQQGISLLKYQNHSIDFRIHTNKDEQGEWRLSAIAAKIAGPGSVTTHVKSGGQVKSVQEIWEDLRLNKALLDELKKTSLQLSQAIDTTTSGYIGEIGFDLGIDEANNIWMFEANSKPGRTIFTHPKLKREDQLTRKMPMDYANYLYQLTLHESDPLEEMLL